VVVCSLRDNGLFPGTVSYYPGVAVDAKDTSAVDSAQVAQMAAVADYIVVCVGPRCVLLHGCGYVVRNSVV
jgi:hypothetical protein